MLNSVKSFFRPEIDAMAGYTPGEQPRDKKYIKLNTNENPYPPSPKVAETIKDFDYSLLRLYPDPVFCELRKTIASLHGINPENIFVGNGSDDILTVVTRCFCDSERWMTCCKPSYSLYSVLAQIQGCKCLEIPLSRKNAFQLPANFAKLSKKSALIFICRPNAPTGNAFPLEQVKKICSENKDSVILIDEAYADFADDNCMSLIGKFRNVIVMRTLSKAYSLAGLRLGYAMSSSEIINGMMKVKDSYNVSMFAQRIAISAFKDQKYLKKTVAKIRKTRKYLSEKLVKLGFSVFDSQSNFILTEPPSKNAAELYSALKNKGILVRYFPQKETKTFVRITIGTDDEINLLIQAIRSLPL